MPTPKNFTVFRSKNSLQVKLSDEFLKDYYIVADGRNLNYSSFNINVDTTVWIGRRDQVKLFFFNGIYVQDKETFLGGLSDDARSEVEELMIPDFERGKCSFGAAVKIIDQYAPIIGTSLRSYRHKSYDKDYIDTELGNVYNEDPYIVIDAALCFDKYVTNNILLKCKNSQKEIVLSDIDYHLNQKQSDIKIREFTKEELNGYAGFYSKHKYLVPDMNNYILIQYINSPKFIQFIEVLAEKYGASVNDF